MIKKSVIFVFAFINILLCSENGTIDKIKKYSGQKAAELTALYNQTENSGYVKFILDNSSPNDLAVLDSSFINENIRLALKTKELKYAGLYSESVFKHFVLPLRSSQEPFENWRGRFYKEIYPLVKDVADIEEAAILVNLWTEEQMTYKSTHGKDQGPLTTIRRGYGRCEEMMIIYMAAARSAGIPVRSSGSPLWSFTDSNHAWVEVWTPSGWKYLGAGESSDQLNKTWFTKTTERASIISSMAFGNYNDEDIVEQKNNSTETSSIRYYTREWDKCTISVTDESGKPVEKALVVFYAVSWGGISPMQELKSDKNGIVNTPLGRGSVFVSAYDKEKGFGYSMFNTLEDAKEIGIVISRNNKIPETELVYKFQIVSKDDSFKNEQRQYFEGKFDLMKDKATLKRKDRLNNYKKTADFAGYFLKSRKYEDNEKFVNSQKDFLNNCDLLGGNTDSFIKAFQSIDNTSKNEKIGKFRILTDIIQNWDEKELCEIPDSAAVIDLVEILFEGKKEFRKSVPDSIFVRNVISPTWSGGQVVQNGWQKEFYGMIKGLRTSKLKTTAENVLSWADSNITVDSNFVFYYYSCPLNPLEIVNMGSVPEYYRSKLVDSALKMLGVPTMWKGQLEYFNGKEFVILEPKEGKKEEKVKEKEIRLSLYADGKKIKAEPWGNFQMSELADGELDYYYCDGKNDSLDFIITYPENKKKDLYIQAGIRNSNGDAHIVINPITQDEKELRIDLKTPKEYLDISGNFKAEAINSVKNYISSINLKGKNILMIRGAVQNEPTQRMTSLLLEKLKEYKENSANLVIYTENRDDSEINEAEGLIKKKGGILIQDTAAENYPVVILFDENNNVIFASKGYNMNIGDLLLKKIRNN